MSAPGPMAASDTADRAAGTDPAHRAPVRVATRGSALALAQSTLVAQALAERTGRPVELVTVVTRGDVDPASLSQIGGTGVFVAAVREAVLDGRADVAVHSLKDLPTLADPRLTLAAVPTREDVRDALVSNGPGLAELPSGARVGTGSPRRRAQLKALRPDLDVIDLRGNVDTRIARVDGDPARGIEADLAAVVLAAAGLNRLGRAERVTELIEESAMLPAPGQGALAIEVAAPASRGAGADASPAVGPADLAEALADLDHPATRAEVCAERAVLATLDAGCSAPVGALARDVNGELVLRAVVAAPDGALLRARGRGPRGQAADLGRQIGADLLAQLAARTAAPPPARPHHPEPPARPSNQGSSMR